MRAMSLRAPGLSQLAALAGGAALAAAQPDDEALLTRARDLHRRILVLDSPVDLLLPDTAARYADKDGRSQASLAKFEAGGMSAVVLALAVRK